MLENFKHENPVKPPHPSNPSGRSRISPRRGRQLPRGAPTYDFANFSQKLHEIERIWARGGGGGASLAPPLDPPLNPMGKVPSCSSCYIKLNYPDTPETSSRLFRDLSERKLLVVVGDFESNGRYFKPQFKLHFVLSEFLARPFSPGIESLGIENTLQADCVLAEGIKFFLLHFYFLLLALFGNLLTRETRNIGNY